MPERLRQAVAPAYLLMCLVLGGSVQGIWTNVLLQLTGLAIIAWAALSPPDEPLERPARWLLWLALALFVIVALQLIPLPPSIWPTLGGREQLAADFRLLDSQLPALPLSLAPYETVATIFRVIPAIAMFCAIVRLRAYRSTWLALSLAAGTIAAILLGALQVASGDPMASPWYLYAQSSWGQAVGFFANANHMGDLLVVTLPFLAALLVAARGTKARQYSGIAAVVAAVALVVVVGVALNRSVAAYILALPVAAASLMMLSPARKAVRGWAVGLVVLLAAAAAVIALGPIGDRMLGSSLSVSSRAEIARTTVDAAREFLPFGSGLGTFRAVYRLYEDHDAVDRVATNHAHNDYLELALETGIPGIVLMLAFLAWWVMAASGAWRSSASSPYARAAAVASAAILFHSLVDYPLRTAALSCVFAMCLGLMSVRAKSRTRDESELWPTRHLELN